MRFEHLTPNQFTSIQSQYDTVLAHAASPHPLDPAVAHLAALWIGDHLTERVAQRFRGRVAMWPLGPTWWCRPSDPIWLAEVRRSFPYPSRFGVLVTDRLLVKDALTIPDADGVPWVLFDWHRWLQRRVDPSRRAEAWAYLSHACPAYEGSPERRRLGLPEEMLTAMAREGNRLFGALESALADRIQALWNTTGKPGQADR
ncbi:hypothetical protein [Alicyclobacillus sp.]|uniref:hypothetical protein n=1 Tax=Alicyclobacillus sp. TaxID=61169 RepID=UPI0025B7AE04|nr:hypothetical protein [Alicyclobacillus sp.]MCL6515541.1 hypothetical protein [Alicyclobacillus sp.]